MPLNGSGIYALPSPQFPAIPNTLILASNYNAVLNDVAAALSQAVFRDGQGAFTGNQSMGGCKLTNMAAGTADTDSVRKSQLLDLFPIGAIYLTAGNTNPGSFLGGTWSQIAQGRTLIGVGALGSDTYAGGATGGAARVTLTTTEMPSHNHGDVTGTESADHTHSGTTASDGAHAHTASTGTAGAHTHDTNINRSGMAGSIAGATVTDSGASIFTLSAGDHTHTVTVNSAGAHTHTMTTGGRSAVHTHSITAQGDGAAHENRMPYLAVYFWQRTA